MTDLDANVVIILIVAVFATISAAYSYGINPLIRFSQRFFRNGKHQRATRLYTLMLMVWPHRPEIMIMRGYAFMRMGKARQGMNDFERAIQQNPDYYVTHKHLGDVYVIYENDFELALRHYDRSIELEPRMQDAYVARAQLRVSRQRELDLALADCDEAIKVAEPEFREHRELGSYIQNGEKIATYYGQKLVQLYTLRAMIYAEQGERDQAQTDLASAQAINEAQAIKFHATMLIEQKAYLDALEVLKPLTEAKDDVHKLRGNALYLLGDYAAAQTAYNQALELDPQSAYLYHDRAENHLAAGEASHALTDFQAALALRPNMLPAQVGQAVAYYALGNVEAARQSWQKLLKLDARFADAAWVGQRLNWTQPIIQHAQRLIADL